MFSHAALNASLNGTSAVLLAGDYAAIRGGKIAVHKAFMISAFAVSSVFLISYLVYHARVGSVHFRGKDGSVPSISSCWGRTPFLP
jgi:putative membrane protein